MVGVVFNSLAKEDAITPSLFSERRDTRRFDAAVDDINQRFGKNAVYLAGLESVKDRVTEKIAFDKTWLFSEGREDNVWPDTFRGGQAE
jgi:DNA polymerase-4